MGCTNLWANSWSAKYSHSTLIYAHSALLHLSYTCTSCRSDTANCKLNVARSTRILFPPFSEITPRRFARNRVQSYRQRREILWRECRLRRLICDAAQKSVQLRWSVTILGAPIHSTAFVMIWTYILSVEKRGTFSKLYSQFFFYFLRRKIGIRKFSCFYSSHKHKITSLCSIAQCSSMITSLTFNITQNWTL